MGDPILLRADTLSLGYFREDRPYNAYHWVDTGLSSVALYFNISDRTHITADSVAWRDLTVDVLITPDARCRVLDEDELPVDIDAGLRRYIDAARAELCRDPLSRLDEYDKLSRSLLTSG